MLASLGAALAAGIVGSPHCAGMCGGFATACARPRGGLALWHAGRLTTYAGLGAVAGGLGGAIPGPGWVPAAVSVPLLVWFSLSLAGVRRERAPVRLHRIGRAGAEVLRRDGPGWRYVFGLLNGLIPCGMVYAAISIPVALAAPLPGALAMLAFGAGTVPALTAFPALLQRFAARSLWHRRAVAALVLGAGLLSIGFRAQGAPAPAPDGGVVQHHRH